MTRVLFLEPMTSVAELVGIARRAGHETVVASHDHAERRLPDDVRAHADRLLVVDLNDEQALLRAVLEEHERAPIGAVLPGIEFYVATAGRVAAALGLPGIPPERADALRDKALMHASAVAGGLRRPVQRPVEAVEDLDAAAAATGFPAVLKPRDSAGSIHVTRVEDLDEVRRAYRAMCADRLPDDVGRRIGARAVLEGYVAGPELSLDGFVGPDGPRLLSVTRKYLGQEPHFVEVGHLVGPWHDPDLRRAAEDFVRRLCAAFGLTSGPFHAEVRHADGELVLIELGARLPGGRITRLVELVTGVSLPLVALAAALGRPPAELGAFGAPAAAFAGVHNFVSPGLRQVSSVRGVGALADMRNVVEYDIHVREGTALDPYGDFRSRLGYVVFTADDPDEEAALRRDLAAAVQIA